MDNKLVVSVGQYSHKGRKEINQDFHDLYLPSNHLLTTKGIAVAIADGISSSEVSQEASKLSVVSFLQDYYSTSESWSVKKSASTIINSINSWLYSQNRKNLYHLEKDKGYVSTFSSIILKSTTAYLFHIGDVRIYKIRDKKLEQLTEDHRTWISKEKSYLSRALGIDSKLNIDYYTCNLELGDIFMLATDGVYEFVDENFINQTLARYEDDLDAVAKIVVDKAYENGSGDNLTVQFVKIEKLPNKEIKEIHNILQERPLPHILEEGEEFDGYKILRTISHSSRSHVYLARDIQSDTQVVIKIPSTDQSIDEAYLDSFLLEEWIAKRINNIHVLKAFDSQRKYNYLYTVFEYIDGITLAQWIIDNPKASLIDVRNIIEQIANGLQAFHRLEMVYKDLRAENIMIDKVGNVKIIDFGSVSIKGINEIDTYVDQYFLQGTAVYSAPEYFLGVDGDYRSDQFSLAVLAYQMLSDEFPYGVSVARATTKSTQNRLVYSSLYPRQPIWVDEALKKALNIDPKKRYPEISEFLYDLKNPNKKFINKKKAPLLQREPEKFWKWASFIELVIIILIVVFK